jgi:hypothetical protein
MIFRHVYHKNRKVNCHVLIKITRHKSDQKTRIPFRSTQGRIVEGNNAVFWIRIRIDIRTYFDRLEPDPGGNKREKCEEK